jgi:hypothetical protein
MKMARAGFRLRAVDFVFAVTVFSVIRNEHEVECHSLWFFEKAFWQLFGECLVDEQLKAVIFGQGFQNGSGNGSVIGCSSEISAGGEEGLDATEGTKEDIDEDGVAAFCSIVLLVEQSSDGSLEVLFDNLASRVKIPSWRAHSFLLKKGVGY